MMFCMAIIILFKNMRDDLQKERKYQWKVRRSKSTRNGLEGKPKLNEGMVEEGNWNLHELKEKD